MEADARTTVDESVWRRANELIAASNSAKNRYEASKKAMRLEHEASMREMRREFAAFIDFGG